MYLHGIETQFNRSERNSDRVEERTEPILSAFAQPTRLFGKKDSLHLRSDFDSEYKNAHWYILNNCPEVQPYIE